MALQIPELEDGDFIRVRRYEPDQWPESPRGFTFLVSVARKVRFLFWEITEEYTSAEYLTVRVDSWKSGVGEPQLQEAVNAVAADYASRRQWRALAAGLVTR